MDYLSTRDSTLKVKASEAIVAGLAPGGGLFVPADELDRLKLSDLPANCYQALAAKVLEPLLSGFSPVQIKVAVNSAYGAHSFDHQLITPLKKLQKGEHVLELWHGPTAAFKDLALQLLPHLLKTALKVSGFDKEMVILTATSGDTGKAALEGFRDVPGFKILVFYPDKGVSEIQKLQMVTQEGENVAVAAVKGNFDDTQRIVKELFSDENLAQDLARKGYQLSSANSINWGRLAPQIVFYFQAWLSLLEKKEIAPGEKVNFVVPTGNFGNILAGFYARRLGLPVRKLICASNENNVLYDFIRTGVYNSNRALNLTLSPSMDILVSSNLERLLYELSGADPEKISSWMSELQEKGLYRVDQNTLEEINRLFYAGYAGDEKTLFTINKVYRDFNYLIDTHTAVAKAVLDQYRQETKDLTPAVILSTASPFKFAGSVMQALGGSSAVKDKTELEIFNELATLTRINPPKNLEHLGLREIKFKQVIAPTEARHHLLKTLHLA